MALTTLAQKPLPVQAQIIFTDPSTTSMDGLLGTAIQESRAGRMSMLPAWNNGELFTMFSKEIRDNHHKMDWYGEHGGKWLYATALAARQTDDAELKKQLLAMADYLVSMQEPDGYLGSYSAKIRLTSSTTSHVRSWDVWNLSYMTLGLLQTNAYFPKESYLNAARKLGELFINTFNDGKNDITYYGTRYGISATIMLDPVIELYKVTRDDRYLDLAEVIIAKMEARENVKLVSVAKAGGDMETVGDGKAYQLLWNLTALVKLYEVTANADYLEAATKAWSNVRDYHLTLAGGPWGGVGKHYECFNRKSFWNPYGFVETCSTMSWIQLNKELLRITGQAQYAQEIEKSSYNALLAARYPNGKDWAYHIFSNGSTHIAHTNDCCPSSGMLALEEISSMVFGHKQNGIACNLYTSSKAEFQIGKDNAVTIEQKTDYPLSGQITLTLSTTRKQEFPVFVRIPDWTTTVQIRINGKEIDTSKAKPGEYFTMMNTWKNKDLIEMHFPLELTLHTKSENIGSPQGGKDISNVRWFAFTRGPLVLASNGLIEGKDRERKAKVSQDEIKSRVVPVDPAGTNNIPTFEFKGWENCTVTFLPFFLTTNQPGKWRLTWLQYEIN
jgi:DUF1680 family protein